MLEPIQESRVGAARCHLGLSGYQSGDPCSYRAIRKHPDGRSEARTIAGIYPEIPEALGDLNADGWGIYVAVNGGLRDENVKTARAIFIEHDDLDKEIQIDLWRTLELPEPSLQIDTGGKSIHSYWVLDPPIPVDQWRILQADLLAYTNADPAIKNPSRVMRLAGFVHPKTGIPATIIGASGIRYSFGQLRAAIPSTQKTAGQSGDPIPLINLLAVEHRTLIQAGVAEGERNNTAYKIAADALGCERWAQAAGIP